MRLERVYISGPMSGLEQFNFPAFRRAQNWLAARGYNPVNPVEITSLFGGPEAVDASYRARKRLNQRECQYKTIEDRALDEQCAKLFDNLMEADLAAVRSCDAIYMLVGWEKSVGAKRELVEAINNGLEVILQKEEEAK